MRQAHDGGVWRSLPTRIPCCGSITERTATAGLGLVRKRGRHSCLRDTRLMMRPAHSTGLATPSAAVLHRCGDGGFGSEVDLRPQLTAVSCHVLQPVAECPGNTLSRPGTITANRARLLHGSRHPWRAPSACLYFRPEHPHAAIGLAQQRIDRMREIDLRLVDDNAPAKLDHTRLERHAMTPQRRPGMPFVILDKRRQWRDN